MKTSQLSPIPPCLRVLAILACLFSELPVPAAGDTFFVDPAKGSDFGPGSKELPFLTLEKALEHVRVRVTRGVRSDQIYLRGGVYPNRSTTTPYWLTLLGTPSAPAVLSAMPAEPGSAGAVQRKSGRWYERVVFDDAWRIRTTWTPTENRPGVWQTQPGFSYNEWPATKLKWALPTSQLREQVPGVYLFSLAPYMLLQDGRPTVWVKDLDTLRQPGQRHYDFLTGTMYLRPFDGLDPNAALMESWYGGPDRNGHLLRDGEGRALFNGDLDHAAIRGFEFRMLTRTFEFNRRGYAAESERVRQRHLLMEDNEWRYCYIHLLLDANTVLQEVGEDGLIPPAFSDRAHWTIRNNLFFRPTKECFQVHGVGHVFEHNEIIEHGGPWAGPAARVGAVNARNMQGAIIRHNFIWGHDINPWDIGSVFMIEAQGRSHSDGKDNNIFGGQVYEYNVFAGINDGPALVLGKGGVRMRDITVRYNLFAGNRRGEAIQISSPHENLSIHGNIFVDQHRAIAVMKEGGLRDPDLPSSITVENNIFARCATAIDAGIRQAADGSRIALRNNIAHEIGAIPAGLVDSFTLLEPGFVSPTGFDFQLVTESPLRRLSPIPGPFDANGRLLTGDDWRQLRAKYAAEPFQP